MIKRSDLYREWARVLDMIDDNHFIIGNIHQGYFVKYKGKIFYQCEIEEENFLSGEVGEYQFAIAIIGGQPVFQYDVIYLNYDHEIVEAIAPFTTCQMYFRYKGSDQIMPAQDFSRFSIIQII